MEANPTTQAALLGILQGATEFLPISSSAHLLVIPWALGWPPMGFTFDVMLHGGTLLALLVYFRREWRELARSLLSRPAGPERGRLLLALGVGTLPALVCGFLFVDLIEQTLRAPMVTVVTLSLFGVLLGCADRCGARSRQLDSLSWRDALLIGGAQAVSLIPGVSRSGITITAALLLGLSRAEAARFSFLLGTPILGAAALARVYDLWHTQMAGTTSLLPLLTGVVCSFLSGWVCIKYFLAFLQSNTFFPFVGYRLLLALSVWLWLV